MSDAPERIWVTEKWVFALDLSDETDAEEYIRADLAAAKDARIAELDRQLAEAREVKPLEWVPGDGKTSSTDCYRAADGFGGYYTVIERQWWHTSQLGTSQRAEMLNSNADCFAAAQADYTAYILSALKETP